MQIKNFYSSKDIIKRTVRKIFTMHILDKGFISRICKQFLQINKKNINRSLQMNQKFTNEPDSMGTSLRKIQMASRHVRRCLMPLVIRKMQIKMSLRYIHCRRAKIKKEKRHQPHQVLERMRRKWNSHTLRMGMYTGTTTLESLQTLLKQAPFIP